MKTSGGATLGLLVPLTQDLTTLNVVSSFCRILMTFNVKKLRKNPAYIVSAKR
jgi:hypothetical protein